MTKQELLDQLEQCFEEQLELKEKELNILAELAELDSSYKILHSWVSNDLKQIYKENNNDKS